MNNNSEIFEKIVAITYKTFWVVFSVVVSYLFFDLHADYYRTMIKLERQTCYFYSRVIFEEYDDQEPKLKRHDLDLRQEECIHAGYIKY